MAVASESQHWYEKSGQPAYYKPNGKPNTLREARTLGLVPSVSGIIQMLPKPGLEKWKVTQAVLSALTLPRVAGESDEAFCERVLADSQEQAKKAADEGSSLHGATELFIQQKPYDMRWDKHVREVWRELFEAYNINLDYGSAEKSFASHYGYGGKLDWHCIKQGVVLDIKTKDEIADTKKLAYDEHLLQLVAYCQGLNMPLSKTRLLNVFVGRKDAKVYVHERPQEGREQAWALFQSLLNTWCLVKGYDPRVTL